MGRSSLLLPLPILALSACGTVGVLGAGRAPVFRGPGEVSTAVSVGASYQRNLGDELSTAVAAPALEADVGYALDNGAQLSLQLSPAGVEPGVMFRLGKLGALDLALLPSVSGVIGGRRDDGNPVLVMSAHAGAWLLLGGARGPYGRLGYHHQLGGYWAGAGRLTEHSAQLSAAIGATWHWRGLELRPELAAVGMRVWSKTSGFFPSSWLIASPWWFAVMPSVTVAAGGR